MQAAHGTETRPLADFAKLVELFDQHSVSFEPVNLSAALYPKHPFLSRLTSNPRVFPQFYFQIILEARAL